MEPTIDGLVRYICDRNALWATKYLDHDKPFTDDSVLRSFMFTNVWRELDDFSKREIKMTRNLILKDQMRIIMIGRMTLSPLTTIMMLSPVTEKQLRSFWVSCLANGKKFMGSALSFYPSKGRDRAWELWKYKQNVEKHIDKFVDMALQVNNGKAEPWDLMDLFKAKLNKVGDFRAYEFYTSLTYSHNLNFTEYDILVVGPGAKGMLQLLAPNKGDNSVEQLKTLTDIVKRKLKVVEGFRWIPAEYQGSATKEMHKFTPRTMEDCLCEYRKYVNLSNGKGRRRIYRKELP